MLTGAFFLLLFAQLLCLDVIVEGAPQLAEQWCPPGHYLEGTKCSPCPSCKLGYGLSKMFGNGENLTCTPCPTGYFSDVDSFEVCRQCKVCSNTMDVVKQCMPTSNRKCGRCKCGYYLLRDGYCASCGDNNWRHHECSRPTCSDSTKENGTLTNAHNHINNNKQGIYMALLLRAKRSPTKEWNTKNKEWETKSNTVKPTDLDGPPTTQSPLLGHVSIIAIVALGSVIAVVLTAVMILWRKKILQLLCKTVTPPSQHVTPSGRYVADVDDTNPLEANFLSKDGTNHFVHTEEEKKYRAIPSSSHCSLSSIREERSSISSCAASNGHDHPHSANSSTQTDVFLLPPPDDMMYVSEYRTMEFEKKLHQAVMATKDIPLGDLNQADLSLLDRCLQAKGAVAKFDSSSEPNFVTLAKIYGIDKYTRRGFESATDVIGHIANTDKSHPTVADFLRKVYGRQECFEVLRKLVDQIIERSCNRDKQTWV